ncbi:hypothetical protein [Kingella oralis]|uniref:hypothetical protein n=1 Tax=Kingella oralis TaxID=505 RepID=UPI003C6F2440
MEFCWRSAGKQTVWAQIALAQRIKVKTWRSIRQPENKKHASLAGKTCFLAQQPFQAAAIIFQSCG